MIGSISLQERLQMKREPLDKWSIREKLCLASAVMRSGDQNWMTVSRSLKPFGEPNRPADWFHQKNCAAQYGALLEQIDTPKRKKRSSFGGVQEPPLLETPAESILKNLQALRQDELKQLLAEEKKEYLKLQEDMRLLQSSQVSEEQLDEWCVEIEEEERQKDLENAEFAAWLKEREQRKQELERAWRPLARPLIGPQQAGNLVGQKRKASEALDPLNIQQSKVEVDESVKKLATVVISPETPTKPALSPLLTSLLKSPSHQQQTAHAPNVGSSILHSAITQQGQARTSPGINPTIASLLNSSASVTVSPGIQQLVTSAISQAEPTPSPTPQLPSPPPPTTNQLATSVSDLLSDSEVPNLKDIEKTISIDHPLPEMKNEEVDTIISDLIDNNDIVSDPEKHLLNVNDDDIINSLDNELEELANEEKAVFDYIATESSAVVTNTTVESPVKTEVVEETPVKVNLQPVVVLSSPNQKVINEIAEKVEKAKEEVNLEVDVPPKSVEVPTEVKEKPKVEIDPFEFQEDPEIQPSKPSAGLKLVSQLSQNQLDTKVCNENDLSSSKVIKENLRHSTETRKSITICEVAKNEQKEVEVEKTSGSVEIVEVDVLEDEENSNESFKIDPVEEIVKPTEAPTATEESSSIIERISPATTPVKKPSISEDEEEHETNKTDSKPEVKEAPKVEVKVDEANKEDVQKPAKDEPIIKQPILEIEKKKSSDSTETAKVVKEEVEIKREEATAEAAPARNTFTPDYSNSGDIFDDMNIEVKVGKVKRDYSRTKKKEDATDFDLLLAVEKAVGETREDSNTQTPDKPSSTKLTKTTTETNTIKQQQQQQQAAPKVKLDNATDDSNSPWTEEEEPSSSSAHMRTRRRYSTPATPVDSVPNSPASSFDDDRDYRNWKKAVLLVHGRLAMHKYASLFMKSITNDQAPNYHDFVYRPMDLQTIRKNIDAGVIRNNNEFHRDVLLMFANAIMYNDFGSQIYEMAIEMRKEAQEQIQILFQAQQGGDSGPSRRETRTFPAVTADQQQQQQQLLLLQQQQAVKRKRTSAVSETISAKKRKED